MSTMSNSHEESFQSGNIKQETSNESIEHSPIVVFGGAQGLQEAVYKVLKDKSYLLDLKNYSDKLEEGDIAFGNLNVLVKDTGRRPFEIKIEIDNQASKFQSDLINKIKTNFSAEKFKEQTYRISSLTFYLYVVAGEEKDLKGNLLPKELRTAKLRTKNGPIIWEQ